MFWSCHCFHTLLHVKKHGIAVILQLLIFSQFLHATFSAPDISYSISPAHWVW